jgi:uncharacterized membrane protein YfcA
MLARRRSARHVSVAALPQLGQGRSARHHTRSRTPLARAILPGCSAREEARERGTGLATVTARLLLELSLVAMTGAALQGSIGFGFGVFSVPIFLLIEPSLVPGPVLATSVLLTIVMTHREHHAIHLPDLQWAIPGRVLGIAAALAVLKTIPAAHLSTLLGSLVLLAVALTASGLHVPPRPATLTLAGVLSGFMATIVSVGGPPIALLYQRESGARIRGTLSAFFVIGTSLSLIGLHFVHRFGTPELLLAGALIPGAALGYLLSRRIAPWLDRGYTRITVLVVSGLMGALVVLRQVL